MQGRSARVRAFEAQGLPSSLESFSCAPYAFRDDCFVRWMGRTLAAQGLVRVAKFRESLLDKHHLLGQLLFVFHFGGD